VKENSFGIRINGFEVSISFSKRSNLTVEEKSMDDKIENWKSFYDYKQENDGKSGYVLDEQSGYYYNSKLKYYFDPSSGYYFNTKEKYWMYFNADSKEYIKCEEEKSKEDEGKEEEEKEEKEISQFEKWSRSSKEIQNDPIPQKMMIKKAPVNYVVPLKMKPKVRESKRSKKMKKTQKLLGLNSQTSKMFKDGKLITPIEDMPIESNNIGNKMLKAMGYKEGSGLGKDSSGIVEPIKVEIRDATKGLGFQKNFAKPTDSKRQVMQMKTKERYDSLK
jgi:hypothetical protein